MLCQFGAARWVYNKALELKQSLWKLRKENISTYDIVKLLPKWKEEYTWLRDSDSQALQQSICIWVIALRISSKKDLDFQNSRIKMVNKLFPILKE